MKKQPWKRELTFVEDLPNVTCRLLFAEVNCTPLLLLYRQDAVQAQGTKHRLSEFWEDVKWTLKTICRTFQRPILGLLENQVNQIAGPGAMAQLANPLLISTEITYGSQFIYHLSHFPSRSLFMV